MSSLVKDVPAPADFSDVRPAENSFRWFVTSRTNSKKEYLVDVSNYASNGRCSCKDFEIRFEKFLARGIGPAEALTIEGNNLEMRPYMLGLDDLLRCWHICRARSKLATGFVNAMTAAKDAQKP